MWPSAETQVVGLSRLVEVVATCGTGNPVVPFAGSPLLARDGHSVSVRSVGSQIFQPHPSPVGGFRPRDDRVFVIKDFNYRMSKRFRTRPNACSTPGNLRQLLIVYDLPSTFSTTSGEPEGPPGDQHPVMREVDKLNEWFTVQVQGLQSSGFGWSSHHSTIASTEHRHQPTRIADYTTQAGAEHARTQIRATPMAATMTTIISCELPSYV